MKKFLRLSFPLVPIVCLALVGCSPKTQAECLLDVSKKSQTERATNVGAQACLALFPEKVDVFTKADLKRVEEGRLVGDWVFKGGDWNDDANWHEPNVGDTYSRPSIGKGFFSFKGGRASEDKNWLPTIGSEIDGWVLTGTDPSKEESWTRADEANKKPSGIK